MKRLTALLFAMILLCSVVSFAFAEGTNQSNELWSSLGSFFSNGWNDVTNWVSNAWEDAGKWIDEAWGDASKWVEQAWSDSSTWVSDIWGDASEWVEENVVPWWTETFNTVTEDSKNAWTWIQDKANALKNQGNEVLDKAKSAIATIGDSAEENVKDIFLSLLADLDLCETDADKVWETIQAYAEEKGISPISAAKLAIPYLLKLNADADQEGGKIPAVAIAQYLTGIIEKLGISNDDYANELIDQLNEVLSGL